MKRFRWGALLLALLVLLGGFRPVSAQEEPEAWRAAIKWVPASALPVGMEEDAGLYRFVFEDSLRNIRYEVSLHRAFLSMHEVRMTALNLKGSQAVSLPQGQVESAILKTYPSAAIQGIYTRSAEGLWHYLSFFTQLELGYFYRMGFDAATGDLMYYVMKLGAPQDTDYGFFNAAQALAVARARAGDGVLMDLDFSLLGEQYVYTVSLFEAGIRRTVRLNAQSGAIVEDTSTPIALDDGKQTAGQPGQSGNQGSQGQQSGSNATRPPRPESTPAPRPATPPPAAPSAPPVTAVPATPAPTPRPTPYDDDDDDDDDDEWDDDEWDDDEWDDDEWDDDEWDDDLYDD